MTSPSNFPLNQTRIGEMFSSLGGVKLGENPTPENIAQDLNQAQRLVAAAMGGEYVLLCAISDHRSPSEALSHFLSFLSLINPELFGTAEKLEKLRPLIRAVLKDMQDIKAGKIK